MAKVKILKCNLECTGCKNKDCLIRYDPKRREYYHQFIERKSIGSGGKRIFISCKKDKEV